MNIALYIARRYLFSRKSTNAINIISMISMAGVCIGSAALFIILSVFNGFEELNLILYKQLSPDIQITAKEGKFFDSNKINISDLKAIDGSALFVEVLEDNALLKYGNAQYFSKVKGVSDDFLKYKNLDEAVIAGTFDLYADSIPYAVIGRGVEYALGLDVTQPIDQISVLVPQKDFSHTILNPQSALKRMEIYPAGIFSVQQEMDDQVCFVPITFARELFDEYKRISSVEIYLSDEKSIAKVKKKLSTILDDDFRIRDRYELNEILYKVLNTERWGVYLILSFILMIAICNIIGSVTMLVIDKKKDIAILQSMGLTKKNVQKIFLYEGLLIALLGALAGLILGGGFAFLQEHYGIIKINTSGSFLIQVYPAKVLFKDFWIVIITVFIISFTASWFTARHSVRNFGAIRDALVE